jgi:hypothetical protein
MPMIIHDVKPILVERKRKDLLRFARKEIIDLQKDEAIEVVTAEMVVDNLISKYPENTYTPPPKKDTLTPAQKRHAEILKQMV